MTTPLFLTGATGFVGRRVVRLLAASGYSDVRLLVRDPARGQGLGDTPPAWRIVRGDLDRPAEWSSHLASAETVLHLASSTGKVRRREHFNTIVGGTERLLDAAKAAGVRRFLFVSSVAAGFANRRYYHYADAKAAAEALVSRSAFDWLIVRPTMVLGPDSPVLTGLKKLAMLPLPIMFGPGTDPVEPIAVDDLAALLVAALEVRPWGGRTITVGGPDRITTEELLGRIRGSGQRFMHLPLAPLRELLGVLEPVLFPVMPLTAGQLATFANSSVGDASEFTARLAAPRTHLSDMLVTASHDD